jgi:3-methyl-2-oxobutanoate hydroxymethyltransferase
MSTKNLSGGQIKTIPSLLSMKSAGKKIVMLTAYDYQIGSILEESDVDIILVGDSVANVFCGYRDTLPVTMENMLYHTRAVTRAVRSVPVIADMPFLSFHVSIEETVRNAGIFLKEAGASGVKLEGASSFCLDAIERIVNAGMPVMGHIGLTPQSYNVFGGYRVQGKTADAALKLLKDAKKLQEAGVFSIVIENIPDEVAAEITKRLKIPTIGIGAGTQCDGQVLVINDILGLSGDFTPPFARRYTDLKGTISEAVQRFCGDVRESRFPSDEETSHLSEKHLKDFKKHIE